MNLELRHGRINGFTELTPEVYQDSRGFLARIFDERFFTEHGLPSHWREISYHHTAKKHILRGMYVQYPPYSEGKLLRVIHGEMLWVSVDVRKNSRTFGMWDRVVLSATRNNLLCTERGLAHGCISLTDNVDLIIHSDNFFSSEHGVGFFWNDPDLKIDWQLDGNAPIISERDAGYSSFREFTEKYSR